MILILNHYLFFFLLLRAGSYPQQAVYPQQSTAPVYPPAMQVPQVSQYPDAPPPYSEVTSTNYSFSGYANVQYIRKAFKWVFLKCHI